jgi:NOL1/NOP2/sun family putative RNA methylase
MFDLEIPPAFLERMQKLLGAEFPAFQDCLNQPPISGLRVNPLKIDPHTFSAITSLRLFTVPWCPEGFRLVPPAAGTDDTSPGKHPYHAAGAYYLQEPSAMAVVEILDPQPGERILDLAAAPGGKSTHIAARMQNRGLLVANEIHPKRVWELSENLERWGAQNIAITNETPSRLAAHYSGIFDRVLLDAPCSGEGMFRKSQIARQDWSVELVKGCAQRQSGILEDASRLLRPGGVLVYSTCTFAPEENEGVIASFLHKHREFELEQIPQAPGYSPGRSDWIMGESPAGAPVGRTVRLWPHRVEGEGQFIARLRKTGSTLEDRAYRRKPRPLLSEALQAYQDFCQTLEIDTGGTDDLQIIKERLYRLPADLPDWIGLHMIHPGLWLGDIRRGAHSQLRRFEPAHALAMALDPKRVNQSLHLDLEQSKIYLTGSTLPGHGKEGWVLVAIDGFPLGWGKRVKGVVKNLYPRGLRRLYV